MHYYFTCPDDGSSITNPIPLQYPLPLLVLAWTSVIPFFLNLLCICCYVKFPSLRKPPGSFLCFQALLYLLKDGFEIFVSVLSTFYSDPKYYQSFELSKLIAVLCLTLTSLILGYNTALNIYLINVSKESALYTYKRTMLYHFGGWSLAIAYFTFEIVYGKLRSNPWGEAEFSDGAWDSVLPVVFVLTWITCIFYVWRAYRREGQATNSKNLKFIQCFYFYFALNLFYILAKIANIVTYQCYKCSDDRSFADLGFWEKMIVFIGHFLEILFTYIVFMIQFTDLNGRECMKSVLHLKTHKPIKQSFSPLLQEHSESENGILNVQPTLQQHFLNSVLIGMNYFVSKLVKVAPNKLPNLKTNKNEVFAIRKGNLGIEEYDNFPMYEGSLTIMDVNVLIHMKSKDPQLILDLQESLKIDQNLHSKFMKEEHQLVFYTFDYRFAIRILSKRQAERFVKFAKNLFELRYVVEARTHIEKIVGVFQFHPTLSHTSHYFLVAQNSATGNFFPLHCSLSFKKKNMKKFNEIKSIINHVSTSVSKQEVESLVEDMNFLARNRYLGYSIILNVYGSQSLAQKEKRVPFAVAVDEKLNPDIDDEEEKSREIEIIIDQERVFTNGNRQIERVKLVVGGLLDIGKEKDAKKYCQFMTQKIQELFDFTK